MVFMIDSHYTQVFNKLHNCHFGWTEKQDGCCFSLSRNLKSAAHPGLAARSPEALPAADSWRFSERRRLRSLHCAKTVRKPSDHQRSPEDPGASRPDPRQAYQAMDLL